MSVTQAKLPRLLIRTVLIFFLAVAISWALHRSMESLGRSDRPAGFGRGIMQGALMPCALPNLLLGQDVTIYAGDNAGRIYKLGYTLGVNGCGALFFGIFFWRVNRWVRRRQSTLPESGNNTCNTKAGC